ncbi:MULTISPECIES: DegV family protein [unclassified Breznakia]|uniref:DegV family protein n=1 Tax=unclassified Breznakia TaxID=2623764 RepID=UPI002475DA7B|nr:MULTISPECIES: DegV family protein [unclassified Breznakia]MDH6366678.1 DegV family protein with EDD domain [Breznakia sp. PH1-1]MDH6403771.1 DegV family protein with EDD domain [Breznakia sp. PF1-11]MDH6411480.1 DegV family protein with EDD domain [Breznakia sp. PFB1-11]MDH6413789.1 DegV family protein with EDD domain [Breznakia sp. PFB1-14]MDH6416219.1 DegV family protein with EDD domain [Breznakia sp. PFB1-4]
MKNYLIVCDTTSAMDFEMADALGVELLPLSVIINEREFKDLIDIDKETLYRELENGVVPTTSQPSIGYVTQRMEQWKQKDYEAILIFTCSSSLSGANHTYHMVKEDLGMSNVYIIDTRSVAAPILDCVRTAKQMASEDKSVDEILQVIDLKCKNSFSYLYPESLTQLKRGGRISPIAANVASLLRIKILLYLKEDGSVVDKFAVARTETKLVSEAVDKLRSLNVTALTHKAYILHANNIKGAQKVEKIAKAYFDDIECEIIELPTVLTCHGGLGCVAVQTTLKTN